MVQFLSIIFFSWISSILLGFSKFPFFLCHPVYTFSEGAVADSRKRVILHPRYSAETQQALTVNTSLLRNVTEKKQKWLQKNCTSRRVRFCDIYRIRFISLGQRNQVEYDSASNSHGRDERFVWKFSQVSWRDHLEDAGVEGRSIFTTISDTWYEGVN